MGSHSFFHLLSYYYMPNEKMLAAWGKREQEELEKLRREQGGGSKQGELRIEIERPDVGQEPPKDYVIIPPPGEENEPGKVDGTIKGYTFGEKEK